MWLISVNSLIDEVVNFSYYQNMNSLQDNTEGSLTEEQQAIIVGCLLGDGAMRAKTNALLEINHSVEQKVLVDWVYTHLQQFVSTAPKVRKGNGNRVAYRFTTRSLPVFTTFYEQFFFKKKKIIPTNLMLTPLTLAVWFMDDGNKSRTSVYLNTQQFSLEEQKLLQSLLLEQWGIETTLNKDKTYWRIRVRVSSIEKFVSLIKPYLLPEFQYKLPMTPYRLIPE